MSTALEDRIALALDRRADAPMDVDLDAVRRGARHRRARRRAGAALALAVVAGGAMTGIAIRDTGPPAPADGPFADIPTPAIGAAALLPADLFGPPVEVRASRVGVGTLDLPQVDVWQSDAGRLVVRTPYGDADRGGALGAPVTTAAVTSPPTSDVVPVGALLDGAIDQLAEDQWVVYLDDRRSRGAWVIARGMSRDEAQRAFRSLVTVDGVLQPASGYELVQHASPSPAPYEVSWYTQIGFGSREGNAFLPDSYVSVSDPITGRPSLELAVSTDLAAAIVDIGSREVAQIRLNDEDAVSSHVWLDPSGRLVSVWSFAGRMTADTIDAVVDGTRLIGPAEFDDVAATISAGHARKPAVASAAVDGVTVTLRRDVADVVVCVGDGADEQCALDANASVAGIDGNPIEAVIDTVVGGDWVIAGVAEADDGGRSASLDDNRYTMPGGTDAPTVSVESGGYVWTLARVPDDVERLTFDTGGVSGATSRPVVVGPLG